jgi:elongation factor G
VSDHFESLRSHVKQNLFHYVIANSNVGARLPEAWHSEPVRIDGGYGLHTRLMSADVVSEENRYHHDAKKLGNAIIRLYYDRNHLEQAALLEEEEEAEMKQVERSHVRNIGTFGHGGEGKTSLAEAMLFDAGENTRLGRVDDGSSIMDYEPEEINRKISISASVGHFEWNKHQFHLVDTPGYANFIAEAKASMRVVDGAIIVVGANSEVKVHTETVWGYANEFQVPRVLYVSKMDAERADFLKVVEDVKKAFPSQPAVPVQMPIGKEGSFKGVIDLIRRKAYVYSEDGSGQFEMKDVPGELKNEVEQLREKLVEAAVEMDDRLMEKYLESGEVSMEELLECLKKGTAERKLVPAV